MMKFLAQRFITNNLQASRDKASIAHFMKQIDRCVLDCDIPTDRAPVRLRCQMSRGSPDYAMQQLILFRHAKTEPVSSRQDDHDRALTLRGWDDAPRTIRRLLSSAQASPPDLVLCSTARRCQQTLEAVEDILSGASILSFDALYLADEDTLLRIAEREAQKAGAQSVLVIAHNPGIRSLAGRLAPMSASRGGEIRTSFPTASIAALSRSEDTETGWRLLAFYKTSDLDDSE